MPVSCKRKRILKQIALEKPAVFPILTNQSVFILELSYSYG